MITCRQHIIDYLKSQYPKIIHKGELGRLAVNVWNFENENIGRRCRELCEEGIIERIGDDKGRSQYRWKPIDTLFPLREAENKINFID